MLFSISSLFYGKVVDCNFQPSGIFSNKISHATKDLEVIPPPPPVLVVDIIPPKPVFNP